MRGIDLPARAGRADGTGHPEPVEAGEKSLRVASGQGEVRGVGQTAGWIAMKTGVRKPGPHPALEFVAHPGHPRHFHGQRGAGQLCGQTQAHDPRHVFGAGAAPAFLSAPAQERRETEPRTHQQRTDSLRPVKFVRRNRKQMHRHAFKINNHLPGGLHRIGVENNAALGSRARHCLDREDDAGFIVGPDHGDDRRVGAQSLQVGGIIEAPAGIDRQPGHLATLAGQLLAKVFRRAVLDRGSNDVPLLRLRRERPAHRRVDRLCAPAGENHRVGLRPEKSPHLGPGFFQRFAGQPPCGMRARGIAELLAQQRPHHFAHPRIERRGRVVVEVDHGGVES